MALHLTSCTSSRIIWAAVVNHKEGQSIFAATTEDGIYARLASFCVQWWEQDGPSDPVPESDRDIVRDYFEWMEQTGGNEYCEIQQTWLPDT